MPVTSRPQINVSAVAGQIAQAVQRSATGTCDTETIERIIADHLRCSAEAGAVTRALAVEAAAKPGRDRFSTDLPSGHSDRIATEIWRDAIHVHGPGSGQVDQVVVDALHGHGARGALTQAASLEHTDGGVAYDAQLDADTTLCELAFKGWRLVRA